MDNKKKFQMLPLDCFGIIFSYLISKKKDLLKYLNISSSIRNYLITEMQSKILNNIENFNLNFENFSQTKKMEKIPKFVTNINVFAKDSILEADLEKIEKEKKLLHVQSISISVTVGISKSSNKFNNDIVQFLSDFFKQITKTAPPKRSTPIKIIDSLLYKVDKQKIVRLCIFSFSKYFGSKKESSNFLNSIQEFKNLKYFSFGIFSYINRKEEEKTLSNLLSGILNSSNLKSVKHLYLIGGKINRKDFKNEKKVFMNFQYLNSLDIYNINGIKNQDFSTFTSLKKIVLNIKNNIEKDVNENIFDYLSDDINEIESFYLTPPIYKFKNLKVLKISINSRLLKVIKIIQSKEKGKINFLKNLKVLKLRTISDYNIDNITEIKDSFFYVFKNIQKLKLLYFSNTILKLSELKNLKVLIIRSCLKLIEIDFENLTSLKKVNINGCSYLKTLKNFECVQKLYSLTLNSCENLSFKYTSDIFEKCISKIENLKVLKILFCSNSYLNSKFFDHQEIYMNKIINLRKIHISIDINDNDHNRFDILSNINKLVSRNKNLEVLMISIKLAGYYYRYSSEQKVKKKELYTEYIQSNIFNEKSHPKFRKLKVDF